MRLWLNGVHPKLIYYVSTTTFFVYIVSPYSHAPYSRLPAKNSPRYRTAMERALPLLDTTSVGICPISALVESGKIVIPSSKKCDLDFLFALLRRVRSTDLEIASKASTTLILTEDYRAPTLLFGYAIQFGNNPATALATIESLGDLFLFATDPKLKAAAKDALLLLDKHHFRLAKSELSEICNLDVFVN